ncbi:MAG: ABC transporter ATP-binding protein, partial [Shewanella sp.]|nr:ABC transporter ATP-binding protein [Shewanella sp.]
VETFILDLRQPLTEAPVLEHIRSTLTDSNSLEIEVAKDISLNSVFAQLSALGLEVLSMRNKANRLEELFVSLVEKVKEEQQA